jgi:hypothetical protein
MDIMRIRSLLAVAVIFIALPCIAGQIYEWIDENGVKHFTNEPPPPGATVVKEAEEIPYTPPQPQALPKSRTESFENSPDMESHEPAEEPRPHDLETLDEPNKNIIYDDGDTDRYERRKRERTLLEEHGSRTPQVHHRKDPEITDVKKREAMERHGAESPLNHHQEHGHPAHHK